MSHNKNIVFVGGGHAGGHGRRRLISNWPFTIGILIVAIVFCFALFGCNPVKKATRTFDDHPAAAAGYCSDRFPLKDSVTVRDSISFDTLYIQNGNYVNDTVFIRGDTIVHEKACPPAKTIIKTVRRDSIIYRENPARVSALTKHLFDSTNKLASVSNQLQDLKRHWRGKIGIPWWWFAIAGFVLSGYITLRVKNILSPIKI